MKWSDEPYVRVYTRDTPNWVCLSFEARAVLVLLMRKLDRSGQLDFGRHAGNGTLDESHLRGIARLIDAPIETVTNGVTELFLTETLTFGDGVLSMPNFPEAQETRRARTDAERSAAYRSRVNAAKTHGNAKLAAAEDPQGRHEKRHASRDASRFVPSAVPSFAVPSLAGGAGGRGSEKAGAKPPHPAPRAASPIGDWEPNPKLLAELCDELDVVTDDAAFAKCVRSFIDWHKGASGRASKSKDWDAKFRSWIRKDFHEGKLVRRHRTMSEAESKTGEKPLVDASPEERRAQAVRTREALGLQKTGSEP